MDLTQNIILQDNLVLLRPFEASDVEELSSIVYDEDTWRFTTNRISTPSELEDWAAAALKDRQSNRRYTFVIVDKATGKIAGSTSYGNISVPDKRLEIGWTWLSKDYRGSGLNRHCKFLLLQYAFEVLQFERVELKTDILNLRSRKAMQKIGATEEGVLRSHTLMHDGRRRDTIFYSILKSEWPNIKKHVFQDLEQN
ncbi:GNAT family N-acetyltransferase [Pontibacter harenae]|uniref:GNAT family N-acetyltransferase n=1 Tax=Pontibacter harenae TaxID=2894083 RepID=UPI001E42E43C|nr:GNAT family protein [Pontibacter harenae]MCC9166194.1 GNAT family N-acetyltransferase [Pontibacter harenae]